MKEKEFRQFFEPQYSVLDEELARSGRASFGLMSSYTWNTDPKRLLFVLSRYKFAARILSGKHNVLEVGCGDGFCARIVKQHVEKLTLTDVDPVLIQDARRVQSDKYPVICESHNFCEGRWSQGRTFDGVYLLDVLEHVERADEGIFLANIAASMTTNGVIVVGMPSSESQLYASEGSRAGHVNCKTQEELRAAMETVCSNVFMFSMNDELVHTGYARMANYIFAVGVVG